MEYRVIYAVSKGLLAKRETQEEALEAAQNFAEKCDAEIRVEKVQVIAGFRRRLDVKVVPVRV